MPRKGGHVRRSVKSRLAVAALAAVGVMGSAIADAAVVQQPPLVGYQPNGTVRDIIVVGNTAYLGGQFTSLTSANGATTVTRNHAAAIDMTTGNVLPWNPNVNGTVYTILPSGNNIYLGGSFTSVGGSTHKNIAQVNATSGAVVARLPTARGQPGRARARDRKRQPVHRRRLHDAAAIPGRGERDHQHVHPDLAAGGRR